MRKVIAIAVLALGLAGCSSMRTLYGNFVENPEGLNQKEIASDTVEKITELYPPAKTRFELKQPTPDAFGIALVRGLRDRGYDVLLEIQSEATKTHLPLRYVFDQFIDTNVYRVTVMIGNQSLTRPYAQQSDGFVPVGYWVRKE